MKTGIEEHSGRSRLRMYCHENDSGKAIRGSGTTLAHARQAGSPTCARALFADSMGHRILGG